MTSLMDVFVILRPSKGRAELKRITRVANKTKIFAKLLFGRGKLSKASRRRERERKNKEREVRIDEAFKDTAKGGEVRKKVTKTRKPETRREKEDGEVQ